MIAIASSDATFVMKTGQVLSIVASMASFLASGLLLTTWRSFSAPNYLSRQLITYLGFSGLGTSLGFFMSIFADHGGLSMQYSSEFCHLQAFLLQYFYLAQYFWTACFAYHLYQIIMKNNENPEQYLWKYRLISWGFPGISLLYLILRESGGQRGFGDADRVWCWIASSSLKETVSLVFIFNVTVYYKIVKFLIDDTMAPKFKRKAVSYVSVYVLCAVWGILNRIYQAVSPTHSSNSFLSILECIFDPLQPLLNALVYGSNKASIDACKERVCPHRFYASIPSSDDETEDIKEPVRYKSTHRASEGMYDDLDECLLFFAEQNTSSTTRTYTCDVYDSQPGSL